MSGFLEMDSHRVVVLLFSSNQRQQLVVRSGQKRLGREKEPYMNCNNYMSTLVLEHLGKKSHRSIPTAYSSSTNARSGHHEF